MMSLNHVLLNSKFHTLNHVHVIYPTEAFIHKMPKVKFVRDFELINFKVHRQLLKIKFKGAIFRINIYLLTYIYMYLP